MNKAMIAGIVIGAVAATAAGTFAGYKMLNPEPAYAEVVAVKEVNEKIQTPREVCENVAVTRQKPVKDQHQIIGTVAGAVIGGVLGKQVGGGRGQKVATVAGAAGGGYAGNKVQEGMQANDTYTTTERRCRTVTDTHDKLVGYDVSYRLGDQEGQVRMDHDPGDRIPVEEGKLVLTRPGANKTAP